ncbi:transposase [Varunaivibrio sulfuroxidans]|uniref:Transposase n=1 Tax=Varunaivibrio sulfuroxidans TaxID=1773489 RepID=A0A4R3J837_9PROT|nr:transposase [Varunaivibrio sulfuroxidans]TCS61622.1 hypothetical protein EDD55_10730 [Varunaivibrio sulfuroxidans]WES29503.1 transposase [Varunaivibrio sulfuroxidans]
MKKRFTEERNINILKEQEAGFSVKEITRRHEFASRHQGYAPGDATSTNKGHLQCGKTIFVNEPSWGASQSHQE